MEPTSLVKRAARWTVAVAAILLAGALPATAVAATVGVTGTMLLYAPGSGENNRLEVLPDALEPGRVEFRDPGVTGPLGVGTGCRRAGTLHVSCSLEGVTVLRLAVDEGSTAQSVRIAPGAVPTGFNAQVSGGATTNDTLTDASDARMTANGYAGNDTLRGGPGDDSLFGLDGDDLVVGGAGADFLVGNNHADRLYGDEQAGTAGADNPGAGADRLFGESGADQLYGGGGADALWGGDSDDVFHEEIASLSVGEGGDQLDGGGGTDRVLYGDAARPANARATCLEVSLDDAANDGADADCNRRAEERDNVRSTVENVDGGPKADHFTGSGVRNTLRGFAGDDLLQGEVGPDLIDGGTGDDQLFGGDGYDTLQPYSGKDLVDGGPGNDTFKAPVDPSLGPLQIRARDGSLDWVACSAAAGDTASVDLGAVDKVPADGDANACETVSRGPGASVSRLAGVLQYTTGGGIENAVSVGTAMEGETLLTDTGATISPGSGCASVNANRVMCNPSFVYVSVATGDLADVVTMLGSKRLFADGGAGNDRLTGGHLADELTGGTGSDTVKGMEGDDKLFMRDSFADALIECDGVPAAPATGDQVTHDARIDPAPRGCETVAP